MPGITHLQEFQQPALRALVNQTEEQAESTFADRFLPTIPTYERNFAYDIVKTNEYIAAYIGFGTEPPYIDRDAVASKMGSIAYFGLGDIVTYEELQAIHEAKADRRQAVIDAITVKNVKVLNGLRRLIYAAKMEALFKGEIQHNAGDKNKIRFEFGVPAENRVALTAGADFEAANFDIIGFFLDQQQAYRDANSGRSPEVMVGSAEIRNIMLRNTNIIKEAGRPEGSTRVSVEELASVLSNFDLPAYEVISERTIRYKQNGTNNIVTKELVPVNRITFLSAGIGEYLLGPTLENNFQPGLFLENKDKDDPIRTSLRGVGAGFPAPSQPSLIFHMDVYTPA